MSRLFDGIRFEKGSGGDASFAELTDVSNLTSSAFDSAFSIDIDTSEFNDDDDLSSSASSSSSYANFKQQQQQQQHQQQWQGNNHPSVAQPMINSNSTKQTILAEDDTQIELPPQLDYSWGGGEDSIEDTTRAHRVSSDHSYSLHVINESREDRTTTTSSSLSTTTVTSNRSDLSMKGYRRNKFTTLLVYIGYVCTFGILFVLKRWLPNAFFLFEHLPTPLSDATKVVIRGSDKKSEVSEVMVSHENHGKRILFYRFLPFVFNESNQRFEPIEFNISLPYPQIHRTYGGGVDATSHTRLMKIFGENLIDVPVKSFGALLFDEIIHPFYMFQIISVILWVIELYWVYAVCIVIIASVGVVFNALETKENLVRLNKMASFQCPVNVLRKPSSEFMQISSRDLVPGDLVEVDSVPFTVPCDLLLLQGQCVVNESMLTGESVPVVKAMLPQEAEGAEVFNEESDSKYILYCGTEVIQTRPTKHGGKVLALVYRTAFATAKGKLVTSILYPRPTEFKFYSDSFKFIGILSFLATIAVIYSGIILTKLGYGPGEATILALDLFTSAVPPALPVATTVGIAFAITRLKREKIFCIAPPIINVAGTITAICFDKTGTLTEEGLDVLGVRPSQAGIFSEMQEDVSKLKAPFTPLLDSLACCHALADLNGSLIGDPLEVKMFQATHWSLEEPSGDFRATSHRAAEADVEHHRESIIATIVRQPVDQVAPGSATEPKEIEILRRFDFSSKKQRMSVLARNRQTGQLSIYVKGAPEVISTLCVPDSVPPDYDFVLSHYTKRGYRVLACASASIPEMGLAEALKIPRHDLERDLVFSGLLVMQNKLKGDTTTSMINIKSAGIRTIMVTGDNALTAISVARECTLIDPNQAVFLGDCSPQNKDVVIWTQVRERGDDTVLDERPEERKKETLVLNSIGDLLSYQTEASQQIEIAVTGKAFAVLNTHPMFDQLLIRANIFARMSPDQKTELIERLSELDYKVAMCGDGANDCGALKAADVGLSLSEAEASIAAPFTSSNPTIASMITLLREGKAALVTSLQCFKYMAIYSVIESTSCLLLYTKGTVITDFQYLYIDLILILPIAFLMAKTGATKRLVKQKPSSRLVSVPVLISLMGHVVIQVCFQVAVYHYCLHVGWTSGLSTSKLRKVIDTVIITFANFQYLIMAIAFSISKPFRKGLWTNRWYTFVLALLTATSLYLLLGPADPVIRKWFELSSVVPFGFKLQLLAVVGIDLVVTWLFERVVVVWLLAKKEWYQRCLRHTPRYKVLLASTPVL